MPSVFKNTSLASTNLLQVGNMTGIKCYGYNITNTNAAARFVKLWWGAPGTFSSSGDNPTVGTDVPLITIQVPATSTISNYWDTGVGNEGYMYMATTTTAPDSGNTAVGAGDLITSLFIG